MEKSLGTSTRGEGGRDGGGGGGGGGLGASKAGKNADEDEDLVGGSARQEGEPSPFGRPSIVRVSGQSSGLQLLHGGLHKRQERSGGMGRKRSGLPAESDGLGLRTSSTATLMNTLIDSTLVERTIESSSTTASSSQIVLSSTLPPSPSQSGPPASGSAPIATATAESSAESTTATFSATTPVTQIPTSNVISVTGQVPTGVSSANSGSISGDGAVVTTGSTSSTSDTISSGLSITTIPTFLPGPASLAPNSTSDGSASWSLSTTISGGSVIVISSPTFVSTATTRSSTSFQESSSSRITNSTSSFSNSTTTSSTRFSSSTVIISTTYGGGGVGNGGGGGSGGGTFAEPTTAIGTPSPTVTPSASTPGVNPKLVGGIVGGLAALAFVLVAILFALKRIRRNRIIQARDDAGYGGPLPSGGSRSMAETSMTPLAAAAGFFGRRSRSTKSTVSSPPEERGFYRVTGRKLPPAIGGPLPERSTGGPSFYHGDEHSRGTPMSFGAGPSRFSGYTVASTSPTVASSTAPLAASPTGPAFIPAPSRIQEEREEGGGGICRELTPVSFTRPAHGDDGGGAYRELTPSSFSRPPGDFIGRGQLGTGGRDGLGRSLPSHDGSRGSKFTEDIV